MAASAVLLRVPTGQPAVARGAAVVGLAAAAGLWLLGARTAPAGHPGLLRALSVLTAGIAAASFVVALAG
jgi:hypothetical protein